MRTLAVGAFTLYLLGYFREVFNYLLTRNEMDRHFVNEELPRVRYANPELEVKVNRVPKSLKDDWTAEVLLEYSELFHLFKSASSIVVASVFIFVTYSFHRGRLPVAKLIFSVNSLPLPLQTENGTSKTLDVSQKWSSAILEQVLDEAGGDRWLAFKAERRAAGKEPVFPVVTPKPKPVAVDPSTLTSNSGKEGVAAALP
jgi:small subunit ribosomal protein S25